MSTLFIYIVIMIFAGLIAFHVTTTLLYKRTPQLEGMSTSASSSSSSSASASSSASSTPTAVPSGVPASQNPKSQSKTSACGDDCSTYDEINKTLQDFNKLNKRYETSNESVQKVDKEIIQLSKSIKNLGNKKTPGGRPPMDKKMLS